MRGTSPCAGFGPAWYSASQWPWPAHRWSSELPPFSPDWLSLTCLRLSAGAAKADVGKPRVGRRPAPLGFGASIQRPEAATADHAVRSHPSTAPADWSAPLA